LLFTAEDSIKVSILKVAKLGNPVLREVARPISARQIQTADIQRLIKDMFDTMREYGGIGLAAPQVHVPVQIAVIEELELQGRQLMAPQVLINPSVEKASEEIHEDWEGCLSIPDFRGRVPRHRLINVQAYDGSGKKLRFQAEDIQARVIQHETDHLGGKIFLDRMTDFQSLSYLQEFSRYWQPKGKKQR
jgi:peptide deformylase